MSKPISKEALFACRRLQCHPDPLVPLTKAPGGQVHAPAGFSSPVAGRFPQPGHAEAIPPPPDPAAGMRGAAGHSSARAGASRGCRQQSCSQRWWMEPGHLSDQLSALSARHGHDGRSRGIRSITENSFEGASIPEHCFGSSVPQGSSSNVVLWNIFITFIWLSVLSQRWFFFSVLIMA